MKFSTAWCIMPNNTITIRLTMPTLSGQIAEVRDKLDIWIAKVPGNAAKKAETLRLARISKASVTYAVGEV